MNLLHKIYSILIKWQKRENMWIIAYFAKMVAWQVTKKRTNKCVRWDINRLLTKGISIHIFQGSVPLDCAFIISHACCIFHFLIWWPKNIWWRLQLMKLLQNPIISLYGHMFFSAACSQMPSLLGWETSATP